MNHIETLNENRDFQRCYKKGEKFVFPGFISYVLKCKKIFNTKIGITTSKKTGNAVQRNRSRRVIKEAYRLTLKKSSLNPGYKIVFVCRSRTSKLKSTDIEKYMYNHLKEVGIIKNTD